MAAQDEEVPTPPAPLHLSSVPTPNSNIGAQNLRAKPDQYILYQLRLNQANPNQAALIPALQADAQLLHSFNDTVSSVFTTTKLPGAEDKFLAVV
ncbi:hypothetical protein GCM10027422_45520 [Hymenobacter arcticus]